VGENLRIAGRGLEILDCGFRIADFGLRIANCGMRILKQGVRRQESEEKEQKRISFTYWMLATDYGLFNKLELNVLP
jgi:hypothetical protein